MALTNPERNEYAGDSTNTAVLVNGLGGVGSTGGATTNRFAYYGTIGYSGTFGEGPTKGKYKVGYETGFLPDQGGPGATIGGGQNITLNGAFADVPSAPSRSPASTKPQRTTAAWRSTTMPTSAATGSSPPTS